LISETGVLFKVSWTEYYYISFKSLNINDEKEELINNLLEIFKNGEIRIRRN